MRKVKWGILGTAEIAQGATIPGMLSVNNCQLYAIAGRNPEKVAEFIKEFNIEKGYINYDELLDDPKVEAVYIPLPNSIHYEWVLKAIHKKKHVLCEKPMGLNSEQVEAMIEAANKNNVFIMEAFAYLHSPLITAMKDEINERSIGEITYIEAAFLTRGEKNTNIRMRRDTCGGSLYDVGCYCTSLIQWLLNEQPDKVEAVAEFTKQNIDICTNATLKYPSGVRASISCGMCLGGNNMISRWNICGTEGILTCTENFNAKGDLKYTVISDGTREEKVVYSKDNYGLEVEQFGCCIIDGEEPYVSNRFSIMNARVMEKIHEKIGYFDL